MSFEERRLATFDSAPYVSRHHSLANASMIEGIALAQGGAVDRGTSRPRCLPHANPYKLAPSLILRLDNS